jgi:Protein of unknown function (DUF3563)
MNPRTLWDERMGMLMACGSPGSALAYHLGQTTFGPMMVQRGKTLESSLAQPERTPASDTTASQESGVDTAAGRSLKGWLARAWRRLEIWSWQRQMREREAYLAQATDLVDLEARMRDLDGDAFLSRARTLY